MKRKEQELNRGIRLNAFKFAVEGGKSKVRVNQERRARADLVGSLFV